MRAAVRLVFGEIEPNCGLCRRHDAGPLRAEWGCDAPSTVGGVYKITCPRCDGASKDCERCDGSGKARMLRCPSSIVDRRSWDAVEAAIDYTERGSRPVPGGRYEQTAQFSRVVQIVGAERAAIDKERGKAKG